MRKFRNDLIEIENPKVIAFKSVSSLIQSFEEKANQARKNQPSMGLKAHNLKTKICYVKTDEAIESNREKNSKNSIINDFLKSENFKELKGFKSDSNLKKDFEKIELYDCLVDYESNQIYRNADISKCLNSYKLDARSDNNLIPFLDETRQSFYPQPLLSSTANDFDRELSELKLPITPLRLVSNVSKLKKLRSFNKINLKDH